MLHWTCFSDVIVVSDLSNSLGECNVGKLPMEMMAKTMEKKRDKEVVIYHNYPFNYYKYYLFCGQFTS